MSPGLLKALFMTTSIIGKKLIYASNLLTDSDQPNTVPIIVLEPLKRLISSHISLSRVVEIRQSTMVTAPQLETRPVLQQ
jgi:hypothetical protein